MDSLASCTCHETNLDSAMPSPASRGRRSSHARSRRPVPHHGIRAPWSIQRPAQAVVMAMRRGSQSAETCPLAHCWPRYPRHRTTHALRSESSALRQLHWGVATRAPSQPLRPQPPACWPLSCKGRSTARRTCTASIASARLPCVGGEPDGMTPTDCGRYAPRRQPRRLAYPCTRGFTCLPRSSLIVPPGSRRSSPDPPVGKL
jgi:hypothetical protein